MNNLVQAQGEIFSIMRRYLWQGDGSPTLFLMKPKDILFSYADSDVLEDMKKDLENELDIEIELDGSRIGETTINAFIDHVNIKLKRAGRIIESDFKGA